MLNYKQMKMYVWLDKDNDFDVSQDRPVLSTRRTPHDKQNGNCRDYSQNLVMSLGRGSTPRLTD